MTNLFTIEEVEVQTDLDGEFYITSMDPAGYNIIPAPYVYSDSGEFVRIQYIQSQNNGTSVNQIFESMYENGTSFNVIHKAVSARLQGLQKFKAVNNQGDAVTDSKVRILCVIWH